MKNMMKALVKKEKKVGLWLEEVPSEDRDE